MDDQVRRYARLPQDTIGFCMACNGLVRRTAKGTCERDHPADIIYGALDLPQDEEVPQLPRFNWGAFFMPPIWGASHGAVVAGLIVLPLWLFLDSTIQSAVYGVGAETALWTRIGVYAMTALVTLFTLALMFWFGRTGWGLAWRRRYGDGTSNMPTEEFIKRERRWYWICIPFTFALLGFAIYYWIAFLPQTLS
ncbi:MAG: hypothetical protein FWE87_02425 [Coriobacteriia bacterium]|nr:hypothetical protein [Coriobacteriia bacterium]